MSNQNKQTWTVIQTASEAEVKNIGSNLWIKAQKVKLIVFAIFALIIGIGLANMSFTVKAGFVGFIILIVIVGLYFMLRAANRYLETVKDKKVIDLRKKKDEAKK